MKKVLFAIIFTIGLSIHFYGQTLNGVEMSKINVAYMELVGTRKMFSSKINIALDFGQKTKLFSSNSKALSLKDKNGKRLNFNSVVDALNFLNKYGYELVQAYIVGNNGHHEYHYLLKKKS